MEKQYWENYYKNKTKTTTPPSQFAAFAIQFIENRESILIDYGCGNGRDSIFFGEYIKNVIAVDQVITKNGRELNKNIKFCEPCELENNISKDKEINVYARFFLHAITEEEQKNFFREMGKLLRKDEKIFLEFRTKDDENRKKVTEKHYRRYQDKSKVIDELIKYGFETLYECEGLGFALYKDDDAYVARIVAKKSN